MAKPEARVNHLSTQIAESLRKNYVSPEIWALSRFPQDDGAYKIYRGYSLMASLFKSFEPSVQSEFKDALTSLIKSWRNKKTDPEIRELAWLAIDTRNFEAVKPLIKIIDQELIPNFNQNDENEEDRLSKTIGVIGGYGRLSTDSELKGQLKSKFVEWIQNSKLERFSAQLINAICIVAPDSYPEYMPRFLDILRDHADYFRIDVVAMEFKRIVSEQIIKENQGRLPSEYRVQFQKFLDDAFVPKSKRSTAQS